MQEKLPAEPKTAAAEGTLRKIAEQVMTAPEDFAIHPSLKRILQRKREALSEKNQLDWALAETLAFGSLVFLRAGGVFQKGPERAR